VGSSDETLYTLQREQTLGVGEELTFIARYVDPDSKSQTVRLVPGTEVTQVADTHYKMSSVASNGGNDLNASLEITLTWYGDNASVTLHNTGASIGYVNKFILQGHIIRLYDRVDVTATAPAANLNLYGEQELRFNLPYQDNPNTAEDFAGYLKNLWAYPLTQVDSIDFVANTDELKDAMINCGIGMKIAIKETVTGIDDSYFINGVEWRIEPGSIYRCKYYCERAAASGSFWLLGTVGSSELGQTTILGF
jgi:hypothetical protein